MTGSGSVDRDNAIQLLGERAVLTRAVCLELRESQNELAGRRPCAALSLLCRWIMANCKESVRVEPNCVDGIEAMAVPKGYEALLEEIREGSCVGDAFCMLLTADTPTQQQGDEQRLLDRLQAYFSKYPSPTRGCE